MRRIGVAVLLALGLTLAPFVAEAQQRGKVPLVGYVPLIPEPNANTEEFRKALGELGYIDGQSVVIEYRWGGPSELRDQMAELVRLNVDVIVMSSSVAVLAVAKATRTIPIVANDLESDPVASGLAASLARPGGNVTACSSISRS